MSRRGSVRRRRWGTSRHSAFGRSASFGRGCVDEADWAEAWKAHFPVLRVGRRLVIRPTWRRHRRAPDDVVLALDPGMAFGTGLHPTTRLCLAAVESLADRGVLARARVPRRRVRLGDPRDRGAEAGRSARRWAWTRTRSRSKPRAERPPRTAWPVVSSVPGGQPAERRSAVRCGAGQPDRRCPRAACAELSATSCGRAGSCWRRGSSSIANATYARHSRRPGCPCAVAGRKGMGRAGGGPAGDSAGVTGPEPSAAYNRPMTSFFPVLLGTHIVLAVSLFLPSILLPFALRTRRAAIESSSRFVRALLWAQTRGTLVVGAGLALTGLALVATLGPAMLAQPWLHRGPVDLLRESRCSRSSSSVRAFADSSGFGPRPMTRHGGNGHAGSATCPT